MENKNEKYFHKPSLILRFKSMMIDTIVLIIIMFIAAAILNTLNVESGLIRAIPLVLILLYEPISTSIDRTIGQRVMGLRVRSFTNYINDDVKTNISILNSFIRYFTKLAIGWISLITIHSNKYGQAIHDKLGKSLMTIE